jgi:hypothetical protein
MTEKDQKGRKKSPPGLADVYRAWHKEHPKASGPVCRAYWDGLVEGFHHHKNGGWG